MSGKSKIDVEGSRLGVHASSVHDVNEVLLLLKVVSIIDNTVVDDLSDEADWRLGSEPIKVRHVQIIHEVDECLTWWRSESSSGSLVHLRLNDNLECLGISVGVEVDGSIKGNFLIES